MAILNNLGFNLSLLVTDIVLFMVPNPKLVRVHVCVEILSKIKIKTVIMLCGELTAQIAVVSYLSKAVATSNLLLTIYF